VLVGVGPQVELGHDPRDVALHGPQVDHELRGDRGVRPALGHQLEHDPLPLAEPAELLGDALTAHEVRDDCRVEHGAATGDRPDRVGQDVDVDDPVLEQVAEPLGM
jgi:hypothetical protein